MSYELGRVMAGADALRLHHLAAGEARGFGAESQSRILSAAPVDKIAVARFNPVINVDPSDESITEKYLQTSGSNNEVYATLRFPTYSPADFLEGGITTLYAQLSVKGLLRRSLSRRDRYQLAPTQSGTRIARNPSLFIPVAVVQGYTGPDLAITAAERIAEKLSRKRVGFTSVQVLC